MPGETPRKTAAGGQRAITITIGADGRILFHDLPRELLPVAELLCPRDNTLRRRRAASGSAKKGKP